MLQVFRDDSKLDESLKWVKDNIPSSHVKLKFKSPGIGVVCHLGDVKRLDTETRRSIRVTGEATAGPAP